jgi:hypothetical protein
MLGRDGASASQEGRDHPGRAVECVAVLPAGGIEEDDLAVGSGWALT